MSLTRLKTFVKMLCFFPYKSKIAPPHSFSLCSSAVRFRYSYSNYRQTFSSSIALCMSLPCQLLLDKFIANLRLHVALIVPRINIRYVLSFIFYHKFLKKSSLFALTSCEITKIQKFTHNSFLLTHFRYLSALPYAKTHLRLQTIRHSLHSLYL